MKRILFSVSLVFLALAINAQDFPQPSPKAKSYQVVGLTEMEIEYSRPGVKDRVIFGELVAYDKLWRTGANRATKITFGDDVKFGGQDVAAGTYAVFTTPMKDKIKVMLNSNADQGGTSRYDAGLDVATVEVPFGMSKMPVERMRFSFENVTDNSTDLVFAWSDRTFSVPVTVDTDKLAEMNMEEKMDEIDGLFGFYEDAASYYLANDRNVEKALQMAQKSVEMKETFWNVHTLAKAYKANGDAKMALKTAEKSLEMSKEADYQPYVKMNEKLIAELK